MDDLTRLRELAGLLTEAPLVDGMPHTRIAQFIHTAVRNAIRTLPGEELKMLLFSLADDVRFLKLAMEQKGLTAGFDVEVREIPDAADDLPRSFDDRSGVERAKVA